MGFFDGIGSTLVGGLLGGLGGSKSQKSSQTQKPYLPKEYEEGYKRLMEDATAYYDTPYQPPPLRRAQAPTDPFGSRALYDLQQYSDMQGGLLSPLRTSGQNINQPSAGSTGQTGAVQQSDLGKLYLNQLLQGAGGAGTQMGRTYTQYGNSPEKRNALGEYFQKNGGINTSGSSYDTGDIYMFMRQKGLL